MSKKITTENFIDRAREVHENKFDYSKTDLNNRDEKGKICIICPEHGEFWQTPKNHLKGQGCPECGKKYAREYHKNRYLNFIDTSIECFGNKYSFPNIINEYENNRSKITIQCNDCGNTFIKTARDHLVSPNGGCKKCFSESSKKHYIYSDLLKININSFNIKPYEGQLSKNDFCIIICPIHGEYHTLVNTIIKGRGFCKKCSGRKGITKEEYLQRFKNKHIENIEFNIEEYDKSKSKITFRCTKCGKTFKRKAYAMLNQKFSDFCPYCSKQHQTINQTKTTTQYKEDIKKCYGDNKYILLSDYISSDKKVRIQCVECNRIFEIEANSFLQGHGCPYHNCNSSIMEKQLNNFLNDLNYVTYNNDRKILNGHEIDILIPNKQLAIEFDGLYWHNELNKNKNYHINKTNLCKEKGIRLIHIFEDEWLEKEEIVKSRLKSILGIKERCIRASKCEIRDVDSRTAMQFLDENHLQGKCSAKYHYGLYYDNELVSLMSFGKTRHFIGNCKYEYELLRFVNKLNTIVYGGASKLLKHFIKEVNPKSIISYADKRWSDGNLYKKLGFTHTHDSRPNYFYVIKNQRKNRFNFRKSELVKKYNCPENMSEHEFCLSQKWYRIYDCGTMVFELILE